MGENAQSELIENQWEKFRDKNGYVAFFWKHWKELINLPVVKSTMENIGLENPGLCNILSRVKGQISKTIVISK